MHCATLVYPSDNKRLLGGLESILGVFLVDSDSANRSGQSIRADHSCQHSATSCQHRPQHSTTDHHRAHLTTSTAQGTAPAQTTMMQDIYSTGLSIEKSTTVQTTSTVHNPRSDLYVYLINQFDHLN